MDADPCQSLSDRPPSGGGRDSLLSQFDYIAVNAFPLMAILHRFIVPSLTVPDCGLETPPSCHEALTLMMISGFRKEADQYADTCVILVITNFVTCHLLFTDLS
jgi:hypothetical protein